MRASMKNEGGREGGKEEEARQALLPFSWYLCFG